MDKRKIPHESMSEYAEVASGPGAGGYLAYARSQGYTHIEVIDWTSSAGDWSFAISKDGENWQRMWQSNNWPRSGFSYQIDPEIMSLDEALYGF